MSAEARVASISDILLEGNYTVPIYQRPYSWGMNEVEAFLDDLTLLDEQEQHLFGMIVITPGATHSTSNPAFDIIDGQQRITTCLLTIAICHDKLKDLSFSDELTNNSELKENIDELKSELSRLLWDRRQSRQRLLTENESELEQIILKCFLTDPHKLDQHEFSRKDELMREYDQSDASEKSISSLKHRLVKDFDQRRVKHLKMVKNHKQISDHLETEILKECEELRLKMQAIENFCSKVLVQLTSVRFKVDSEYNAFQLFETMNDRGLGISAIDLIKNLGLRNMADDESGRVVFIRSWKEIFEDTLEGNHLTFLRYSVNFRSDFIKKSEVYGAFKERVFDSLDHVKNEVNAMKKYAEYFQHCWYTKTRSSDHPFCKELSLLQSTKTQQWIVIAMSLMHMRDQLGSDEHDGLIKKIYQLIYVLVFTQLINSLGANTFEKLFPELALKIYNSLRDRSQIGAALEEIHRICSAKLSEIRPLDLSRLEDAVIKKNDVARMTCYAFHLSSLNHGFDPSMTLTLEHIYPQNPEEGMWNEFSTLDDETRKAKTYSLGNFILVDEKLNPSVGRKEFSEKKVKYADNRVFDHLVHVYDAESSEDSAEEVEDLRILHLTSFTPEIVEKRTKRLAEELMSILNDISRVN